MKLYSIYYTDRTFDACRPLPRTLPRSEKGARAECKNGEREILIWTGKTWIAA